MRMRMNNGGSYWWDLQNVARYEIPKGSGKHSFFAGAFWIGGLDQNDELHLAATRFAANGFDYWPGLLQSNGEITSE